MGEMAQKISQVDRNELLNMLNVAFAEEWLAIINTGWGRRLPRGRCATMSLRNLTSMPKKS